MSFKRNLCLCLSLAAAASACKNRNYGDAETKDLVGPNTAAAYAWTLGCDLRGTSGFHLDATLERDFEALNPKYSIGCFHRRDRRNNEERDFLVIYPQRSFVDNAFALAPLAQVEVQLGQGGSVSSVAAANRNPDLLDPRRYGWDGLTVAVADGGKWRIVSVMRSSMGQFSLCRGEDLKETWFYAKRVQGGTIDPSITFKVEPCDLPKIDPGSGTPVKVINFKD